MKLVASIGSTLGIPNLATMLVVVLVDYNNIIGLKFQHDSVDF
jgi:hypothetical protein